MVGLMLGSGPLALPVLGRSGGGAPAPAPGGTSAARYSFASSRFRVPVVARTDSANTFFISQAMTGTPAYDIAEPRFYLPAFSQASGNAAEAAMSAAIVIEGLSVKVGGVWHSAPGLPVTIDPATMDGYLTDAIAGLTIPANSFIPVRVAYQRTVANSGIPVQPRNIGLGDANEGNTTTRSAKLTNDAALANSGSHSDVYAPLFMVAKGGDGRPALLTIGDSIGYGANESGNVASWSARGEIGYISRGLDDASTSRRIANCNLCVPGSAPHSISARNAWIAKKMNAVKSVFDATGAWPFDEVISQHGHNSRTRSTFIDDMKAYLTVLRGEWGKPITQVELITAVTTTDGFQTEANMAPVAGAAYNNGVGPVVSWQFNAQCGNDGLPSAALPMRTGGYIDDSFAPWLYGSFDTGNKRDKVKLRAWNSTLALGALQNASSFTLTSVAGLSIGDYLNFGGTADGHVASINAGTGVITCVMTSQVGAGGLAMGARVQAQFHALDGTHPSKSAHDGEYKQAVVDWKIRRGWA